MMQLRKALPAMLAAVMDGLLQTQHHSPRITARVKSVWVRGRLRLLRTFLIAAPNAKGMKGKIERRSRACLAAQGKGKRKDERGEKRE